MILQALNGYYDRMVSEPGCWDARFRHQCGKYFLCCGAWCGWRSERNGGSAGAEGKKLRPRKMPVPAAVTRTSGVKANFLWDKASLCIRCRL